MLSMSVRAEPPPQSRHDTHLRAAASALEASFLSEMLKHSGLGASSAVFGGGEGEDQFASMLRDEQARQLADAGGIGLAESLFLALKEHRND